MLPVSMAEHTFWLNSGPHYLFPTSRGAAGQWREWQECLNAAQKRAVAKVRLYTDARKVHELDLEPSFSCRQATIVIRDTSKLVTSSTSVSAGKDDIALCPWLRGPVSKELMQEQPHRPDLSFVRQRMDKQTWGGQLGLVEGLEVLKIEFEVYESKKEALEELLQRAAFWRFPIRDSHDTLAYAQEIRNWSWQGNAEPKVDPSASLSTYLVTEMMWKRRMMDTVDYIS